MTEAVLGTFADCKILKTRSVLQIIVEIPIEQADEALKALGGIPQPGTERWVGVARAPKERSTVAQRSEPSAHNGEVAGSNPAGITKPHRPFASLPLSQQCGMRCKDGHFFDFMCATKPELDSSPADLVMNIYAICGITSRSELDTNDIAAAKWRKLEADYQAYLTDLAYAGSIK